MDELFVVVARDRGRLKEVGVFDTLEAAERFCDRLDMRGDRDRIVLTSSYLNRPFTEEEIYLD